MFKTSTATTAAERKERIKWSQKAHEISKSGLGWM